MKNKKLTISKLGLALIIMLIMGGLFYWFQVRPAQIKHDCSWVKQTSPYQPAQPPMNEVELLEKGLMEQCNPGEASSPSPSNMFIKPRLSLTIPRSCEEKNKRIIEAYKNGKPEIPSKEWWVQADEDEYKFCLHDKGL